VSASAGLRGVVAGQSRICTVDGNEGKLVYQGYPIAELAEHSSFEEVVFLLWNGRLPRQDELDGLKRDLHANAAVPEAVLNLIRQFPAGAQPMDVLRTAVSALGMWDPDSKDDSIDANRRKALRLTAQIPTLVAAMHRLAHGREPLAPRDDLDIAGNFLYMLSGETPSSVAARTFDIALILHADHELNASTFSARVTIATLADMYSAITSAIGTLSGPLHGGANEAVFRMLEEVGTLENVEPYINAKLATKGARVMGIGHAVYKTTDPRARHLKKMAKALAEESGNSRLYEISIKIEEMMLAAKGLHANVDFYSATVYHVLGIPTEQFTPVFAVSRISGWSAHVLEQLADNRIIRPRAEYVGPVDLKYVPISER
jgi:citrate synthase